MIIAMWGFAKVLIGVWASLSILDDVGNLLNIIPLGLALLPGRRRDGLCSLCDAVVADVLLKGSEGIEALPCGMICMRVGECVRMCERIKAISANSTTWPCEAAGYCGSSSDAGPADWMATPQCQKAALGMCRPSRLCERRWRKPIAWNATSSQVIVRAPTACESTLWERQRCLALAHSQRRIDRTCDWAVETKLPTAQCRVSCLFCKRASAVS